MLRVPNYVAAIVATFRLTSSKGKTVTQQQPIAQGDEGATAYDSALDEAVKQMNAKRRPANEEHGAGHVGSGQGDAYEEAMLAEVQKINARPNRQRE